MGFAVMIEVKYIIVLDRKKICIVIWGQMQLWQQLIRLEGYISESINPVLADSALTRWLSWWCIA